MGRQLINAEIQILAKAKGNHLMKYTPIESPVVTSPGTRLGRLGKPLLQTYQIDGSKKQISLHMEAILTHPPTTSIRDDQPPLSTLMLPCTRHRCCS